jgi:hypothetical protein
VRRDGVGTVTERALIVELFGDPGHGDQRDGGGDEIEFQVAQPGQILQVGIAHKVGYPLCIRPRDSNPLLSAP